jgi:hypothetical protein
VYKSRPTTLVGARSPDRGLGYDNDRDFGKDYRKAA